MSGKYPWFRMYAEFLNDPKIIALAFEDQRHYIGLLALKCDGALDAGAAPDLLDRIVAQRLWVDFAVIREVKKRLVASGLISEDWQPLAWNKRQMLSDSSTSRVAKFRAKKKAEGGSSDGNGQGNATGNADETLQKHESNGLEEDTDTEDEEANASLSTSELPDCPHGEIIDLFAKHLPTLPQPKAELWTGQRAKHLRARWAWVLTAKKTKGDQAGRPYATDKASALKWFARYFTYVAEKCPHLTGLNDRAWTADLAWLSKADNFAKVLQGNYEIRTQEVA